MGTLFRENARFAERRPLGGIGQVLANLHLDGPLLAGLGVICAFGLFVLYSAVGQNPDLLLRQVIRLGLALLALVIVAQLSPALLRRWTPWGYLAGLTLLALVLILGEVGQGAQRWLDIGVRFQPSEIMKLAVPMMVAAFLHDRPLPPRLGHLVVIGAMIVLPALMIAVQPDLGTALLIVAAGVLVVLLAGMSFAHILRSEEHTSELQSLRRISYAVFCLKKKKKAEQTPNRKVESKQR